MQCRDDDSPTHLCTLPYSSSLATSASASSQSVWSDAASVSSDDTSVSTHSDSDACNAYCASAQAVSGEDPHHQAPKFTSPWNKQALPLQPEAAAVVPAELRQNPRRTSSGCATRTGCPPALLRQSDRKVNFVDSLVDTSTQIVEAIWPLSSILCRSEMGSKAVLPLRTFIQETLRRSRTSYSTLQVALYYLVLIKPHVPKHDFTMEQPDDSLANRVLQCGRRMFLAALILASKYLQDRNYSARAWSKISGLNTLEINQNEMAFLLAVDWKLHIADEVFQRWTDIVVKYTPPAPPSPGAASQTYVQQCLDWKQLVLRLSPALDNVDDLLLPSTPKSATTRKMHDFPAVSPRSLLDVPSTNTCGYGYDSSELTPTPKARSYQTPSIMEPSLARASATPGRFAPALGLLPTPRLTPQSSGLNTPAVSATSYLLGKNCAMGMAMAQASSVCASQAFERWPSSTLSSPVAYVPTRRSSLANSASITSSPESMVSDSSRTSRSSSISSASSVLSAAPSSKLGVPARFRHAKLCGERPSLRTTATMTMIASVPEDYEETRCLTASPETYTGPVGTKLGESSLEMALARRQRELDEFARDPANDAARALHELQHYRLGGSADSTPTSETSRPPSLKRSRTASIDHSSSLQDEVRELLNGATEPAWPNSFVRPHFGSAHAGHEQIRAARKRVCCSAEASEGYDVPSMYQGIGGIRRPGMWEGILN